jgi:tetratricopeptide (TPR) repeat protein/tRNA A-37 threonylcarbamoyl transferase component Bud32
MAVESADRNLLFGILAVQLDFVTKDALVAAMNAWLLDKGKPLGDILRDRGDLSAEELQHLSALVNVHLKRHGNDPQQSLAALSSIPSTLKQELADLPDAAVQQSIARVGGGIRMPERDPYETVARPAGSPGPAVRYRILRPHARGGLGEVFVAEDAELGRQVALKEIQDRYADDAISRDRFVREAEITGGLEHPGIVPVYGLGTYADGRPFYAMRFIKGDNLKAAVRRFHARATDGRRASFDGVDFRQLLRRFIDVCNAIAYAHSRGVLHRDLKPGNIMLGKYGETLVVDWGLAKPTGRAESATDRADEATLVPRSGGESSATVAGQALGTPAYMSPEQAAGELDKLGPAADVYSLGATLYELLTDRTPFTEVDLDAVQKGRFPPPRAIQPTAPRPLEAVCLKAMARTPEERYGTALELAADIEHWLADEPVTAWREPVGVRMRRWVRRHARLVTGIAAALAVGATAMAGLAWQREQARAAVAAEQAATATERDKAAAERDRAVAARARTRSALDAMVSNATGESLARQTALSEHQRQFLADVLKYYEEFAAEPGEDRAGRQRLARAHVQLGTIRDQLGQTDEAADVFRRAAELYAGLASDYPTEPAYRAGRADCQNRLGTLFEEVGKPAEAESAHRAALATYANLVDDFPAEPAHRRDLARSYNNLGATFAGRDRLAEAVAAFRAALAVREKLAADFPGAPEYRRDLAMGHSNLALMFARQGKRPEAEAAYSTAIQLYAKLAADFPAVADYRSSLALAHHNLGGMLSALADSRAAESLSAAVALCDKLAADFPAQPEYRRELARCHHSLAIELARVGRRAEAEAAYRASLTLREQLAASFPAVPGHRSYLAASHYALGTLLEDLGKVAEAEAAYRSALTVYTKLAAEFPGEAAYLAGQADCGTALGLVLASRSKPVEAKAAHRTALALREKLIEAMPAAPEHRVEAARICINLGRLARATGDLAAAVAWQSKAVEYLTPIAAVGRPAAARQLLRNGHWNRAMVLTDLRRYPEALSDWEQALKLESGAERSELLTCRADCLVRLGRVAEAVADVEALATVEGAAGNTLYNCACVLSLASAAADNPTRDGHAARAVTLLRQAIANGYGDIPNLLADADLAPLRGRADYADLLWDLADSPAPK